MDYSTDAAKVLLINGKNASSEHSSSDPEGDGLLDADTSEPRQRSGKTTGTFGAIFIVVNAAMGAGLLNIPDGFKLAGGIGPGIGVEMVRKICIRSFSYSFKFVFKEF